MIQCSSCRRLLSDDNFYPRGKWCKDCHRDKLKERRSRYWARGLCLCSRPVAENRKRCSRCIESNNLAKTGAAGSARRRKVKEGVFTHYGGKCTCCGESQMQFLSLDHVNNDGAQHRRSLGTMVSGGVSFYYWVRKNGYPSYLQILCFNCNHAKALFGQCPHKAVEETAIHD